MNKRQNICYTNLSQTLFYPFSKIIQWPIQIFNTQFIPEQPTLSQYTPLLIQDEKV